MISLENTIEFCNSKGMKILEQPLNFADVIYNFLINLNIKKQIWVVQQDFGLEDCDDEYDKNLEISSGFLYFKIIFFIPM